MTKPSYSYCHINIIFQVVMRKSRYKQKASVIDWLISIGCFRCIGSIYQPFNGGCCYQTMASFEISLAALKSLLLKIQRNGLLRGKGLLSLTLGTIYRPIRPTKREVRGETNITDLFWTGLILVQLSQWMFIFST